MIVNKSFIVIAVITLSVFFFQQSLCEKLRTENPQIDHFSSNLNQDPESTYSVTDANTTSSSVTLQLIYDGQDEYYIKPKSTISKRLIFIFKAYTFFDFNFKIFDAVNPRYEVYQGGIFPEDKEMNFTYPMDLAGYQLNYTEKPFTFKIIRKADNATLFESDKRMVFSNYYLEISTLVDSRNLFGLSERFTNSYRLKPGKWTIFPRDRGQMMDTGIGKQTHGHYPIYMAREHGARFHMNYFRSSTALDVIVEESGDSEYKLTYKTIGGILDFRFFMGETNPQTLITRFNTFLGQSAIPPFWSMGFHQSRWGYNSSKQLLEVISKYNQSDIPLDTIWSDIDYMNQFETFTVDEENFPLSDMQQITDTHHYIPIVEAGIWYKHGNAYEKGHEKDLFIKDAEGVNEQIGKVWNDENVFVDWFYPEANAFWAEMLEGLYQKINFSGIWIDMNEISNLCNGPCTPPTPEVEYIDYTNDIPYHPGNDSIETQAIPLNATHFGNKSEANVHTFFGFMETYATNLFLREKGRPFIISRSSTLGSNKYGFHWTGDNYANFSFLRASVASNFMFNFWGIQMVGSDICGFGGNATEENCARWFQVGSMYPFSRNHNEKVTIGQQAYALGDRVKASAQKNLKFRYSILKAYYREFIIRRGFGSIFRPLMLEFYGDSNTLNDEVLDTQFLIGQHWMGAPVLDENVTQRSVYFPFFNEHETEYWFDFHTGNIIGKPYKSKSTVKITNEMDDLLPFYLRGRHLTLIQDTTNVTKSSQLDNVFQFVGAYHKNPVNKSTPNVQTYESAGGALSLQDYNNETKIAKCIRYGCNYDLFTKLIIEEGESEDSSDDIKVESSQSVKSITLEVQIAHVGERTIIEQLQISGFKFYLPDRVITYSPKENFILKKTEKKTINIPVSTQ